MYGDAYATVQDLEARLGRLDDGRFTAFLDAASRAVERFTRRQFNRDTGGSPTATPRLFSAVDPSRVAVDDFHTDTDLAISVNGTAWDVGDVELRPWNGLYRGMDGWPFSDLIAKAKVWPHKRYPTINVTAHWGWASVPEGIKEATLDVAEVVSHGGASSGVVQAQSIDGYRVSYAVPQMNGHAPSELVKAEPYRRVVHGVA